MRYLLVFIVSAALAGDRVDLATFGKSTGTKTSSPGIEWDEPREFSELRVSLKENVAAGAVQAEYWVSSWPPIEGRGGWTLTDSPWIGKWTPIQADAKVENGKLIFRFKPLSAEENPNAARRAGWAPTFRRALKVRVRFPANDRAPTVTGIEVYGQSRWNTREVLVESGCEGKRPAGVTAVAYNGKVLSAVADGNRLRLRVLYTEHEPGSTDATIVTLRTPDVAFGVSVDDLIQQKAIYVRDAGIFVGDGAVGQTFAGFLASGRLRLGRDIKSMISKHAEQSLDNAMAEIPALSMTNRRPYRYIPLGFTGNRYKYGLMFNGNVFVSKRGSKLFEDEQPQMMWNGDQITYRIGTGETPDFRERERSANQRVLEDCLPVSVTTWTHDGIEYTQQAFATLLDAPLDPVRNRGDEPSVLLMRITAANRGWETKKSTLWFHLDPEEQLRIRNGILESTGDGRGAYDAPRLRASLKTSIGAFAIAGPRGQAARWETDIAPGREVTSEIHLSFQTPTDRAWMERIAAVDYEAARAKVIAYWKAALDGGMKLHVPDEAINRFHKSVLQHILLSVYRDVPTGLYMAPCGTYSYNMFANETHMQARLLDMRGLHDWAGKFVEPFVALQGSKPFPGRFKDGSAIYHGARVDKAHDYTHSGYNLNHGWTLWTLSEHFLFTRDEQWLRQKLPSMKRAADWIISERKATLEFDEDGQKVWEYGLLPAGQLEDNEEWLYWYAVNGYAYRGLKAFAAALAEADPAGSRRYASEAESYRKDIRAAALRSMAAAPVAQLQDGTWVPVVPPRTHLHGRDTGWIRNILYGPLAMIDCGIFDPHEQVAEWILKDHEDNLFMAPWSFSVPESQWFSRGGITLQPNLVNTPVTYLLRDEVPEALRSFYNTFADSYYPDVNCFTEWTPSFGTSGGPFFKTSDEAGFLTWLRLFLLREDGDTLYLASGAPRKWFQTGQTIKLADAATFFGKVSYTIDSHAAEGYIDARLDLPAGYRGRQIALRIRHPENKKILRVERNSSPWKEFDAGKEFVHMPTTPGVTSVRVYFR